MPIPDRVIAEAVARYGRERDRYFKLATRVADMCRVEIIEANAIRAQVTSRAKSIRSFEAKLRRFSKRDDKNMPDAEAVFQQVGDLAGVRVAAYRREDEARIVDEIIKIFSGEGVEAVSVDRKDKFPGSGFYRATHCQAFLPKEELFGTYEDLKDASCEIQICSMMAHVWNEVEHDIAYKPAGDGPQKTEQGLLQALGYLSRSGDDLITLLIAANESRLERQTGDFSDVFDFVARLRNEFPGADLPANSGQLFDELVSLDLTSVGKIKKAVGSDRFNAEYARKKLKAFNELMRERHEDFKLDPDTSDLILILILEKYAQIIEDNHPAGPGMGRLPRIRSLATRYLRHAAGKAVPEST